ncbi:hypothetical protein ACJX0J_005899, partial [Zea mays]
LERATGSNDQSFDLGELTEFMIIGLVECQNYLCFWHGDFSNSAGEPLLVQLYMRIYVHSWKESNHSGIAGFILETVGIFSTNLGQEIINNMFMI